MARLVKASLSYIVLPVLALSFHLVAAEVILRVYFTREGMPMHRWTDYLVGHYCASTLDNHLGWKGTENYRLIRHEKTEQGVQYTVSLSQNARGFRQFDCGRDAERCSG
jgi:hypothetical protein